MSTPYWGPDFDALAARPRDRRGRRRRAGPPARRPAAHRQRELHQPGRARGAGLDAVEQVRRGLPGRRYYGGCEVVDRAEEIGIERAKALFGAEHANLQPHSGASANLAAYAAFMPARRHRARHGPAARRPPHPRHQGQLLGQVVQPGALHRARGHRAHRLRPGPRPGARAPAEDDRLRRHGLPAPDRLRGFREIADEVGAYLMVDAAHFIGLVAGKAIPCPVPYADVVTFTTHKVLRGPRGGMIVCKAEHAKAIDKAVFPFMQGGPLMHAVAAKAVALEAAQPGVPGLRPPGHRQRPGADRGPGGRGHAPRLRRHRHPPGAARPAGLGVTGSDAEARCEPPGSR